MAALRLKSCPRQVLPLLPELVGTWLQGQWRVILRRLSLWIAAHVSAEPICCHELADPFCICFEFHLLILINWITWNRVELLGRFGGDSWLAGLFEVRDDAFVLDGEGDTVCHRGTRGGRSTVA